MKPGAWWFWRSLTSCHSSECQRQKHKKKRTCGNSEMGTRQWSAIKGIRCSPDLCREAWNLEWFLTELQNSGSHRSSRTNITAFSFSLRPADHHSGHSGRGGDVFAVRGYAAICVRIRAKAATSASLQQGPDSSEHRWHRFSRERERERGFAENTLQAWARNPPGYQELKTGAHGVSLGDKRWFSVIKKENFFFFPVCVSLFAL